MNYDRIYLTSENCKIEKTDLFLVRVTLNDGRVLENLEPHRLFPTTAPDEYITLLDFDQKELAIIRSIKDLDKASAKAVNDVFREYYLIPEITQVTRIQDIMGAVTLSVETDRGPISFRIKNRNNDIKKLHGTDKMIFRDSNDNRYVISDINALDAASKRLLFPYS